MHRDKRDERTNIQKQQKNKRRWWFARVGSAWWIDRNSRQLVEFCNLSSRFPQGGIPFFLNPTFSESNMSVTSLHYTRTMTIQSTCGSQMNCLWITNLQKSRTEYTQHFLQKQKKKQSHSCAEPGSPLELYWNSCRKRQWSCRWWCRFLAKYPPLILAVDMQTAWRSTSNFAWNKMLREGLFAKCSQKNWLHPACIVCNTYI